MPRSSACSCSGPGRELPSTRRAFPLRSPFRRKTPAQARACCSLPRSGKDPRAGAFSLRVTPPRPLARPAVAPEWPLSPGPGMSVRCDGSRLHGIAWKSLETCPFPGMHGVTRLELPASLPAVARCLTGVQDTLLRSVIPCKSFTTKYLWQIRLGTARACLAHALTTPLYRPGTVCAPDLD